MSASSSVLRPLSARWFLGSRAATFDDIPEDCIFIIASYLNGAELARLQGVSRACYFTGGSTIIWSSLLLRDFNVSLYPSSVGRFGTGMLERGSSMLQSLAFGGGDYSSSSSPSAMTQYGSVDEWRGTRQGAGGAMSSSSNSSSSSSSNSSSSAYSSSNSVSIVVVPSPLQKAAPPAQPRQRIPQECASKAAYKKRYSKHTNQLQERVRKVMNTAAAKAAKENGQCLRFFLDLVEVGGSIFVPVACVTAWLILLLLKLRGDYPEESLSYNHVWLPLWIGCVSPVFGCIVGLIVRRIAYTAGEGSMCYAQDEVSYTLSHSFAAFANGMNNDKGLCVRMLAISCGVLVFCCLAVIFPALLLCVLNGVAGITWVTAFIPLWVAIIPGISLPLFFSDGGDSKGMSMALCTMSILPFIVALLTSLKLAGVTEAPWHLILIPFWIIDALGALLFLGANGWFCFHYWRGTVDDDDDTKSICMMSCGSWCFLSLFFIPGQVVLCLYGREGFEHLSESAPANAILIPLCVLFCFFLIGSAVLSCVVCRENGHSRFEGTHKMRWCCCCRRKESTLPAVIPGADDRIIRN